MAVVDARDAEQKTFSAKYFTQSVAVSISSSGDNIIVSGVSGQRMRIVAFALQAQGTVNWKFMSGVTNLTGVFNWQTREGLAQKIEPPAALFSTLTGDNLIINLSGAVSVTGWVTYYAEIPIT